MYIKRGITFNILGHELPLLLFLIYAYTRGLKLSLMVTVICGNSD